MAGNLVVCSMDAELEAEMKEFRKKKLKVGSALIMKVDRESQKIVLDEILEEVESLEDLRDSLPDHQPRFIVYTCCLTHSDGRASYPMCFIYHSPRDAKPELQMMYAGSKTDLVNKVQLQHVFEVRELEEITEEWLHSKLLK